jgi:hypothetical protein
MDAEKPPPTHLQEGEKKQSHGTYHSRARISSEPT